MHFIILTSTVFALMFVSRSVAHAAPVNLADATKIDEKRRSVAKRIIEGCRYDMYLNVTQWSHACMYQRGNPEGAEQPVPFFISAMSDPDLRSEILKADNYFEKEHKSLGSKERLQSLVDLAKDADFQKFDQAIIEVIKINIIQELCANGLQSKANAIWETLDRTQFTTEWMQWQSLVCITKSSSGKADVRSIDEFIAKQPVSIIGYKAKLLQLTHTIVADPKEAEEQRSSIRNLVKYLLLNFDYSDQRIRVKCRFNVNYFLFNELHIDTANLLFRLLCFYSTENELKDVSDFADKLQAKPFFSREDSSVKNLQNTMLSSYQGLKNRAPQAPDSAVDKVRRSKSGNFLSAPRHYNSSDFQHAL
jgi:hypothetical protein